jgi:hypothetical protein
MQGEIDIFKSMPCHCGKTWDGKEKGWIVWTGNLNNTTCPEHSPNIPWQEWYNPQPKRERRERFVLAAMQAAIIAGFQRQLIDDRPPEDKTIAFNAVISAEATMALMDKFPDGIPKNYVPDEDKDSAGGGQSEEG